MIQYPRLYKDWHIQQPIFQFSKPIQAVPKAYPFSI